MVLAEPVLRPDGLTLAGSGLELTESIIERIRTAGANTVVVEGHPFAGDDGLGNLAVLAAGLDKAFHRHRDNAFMMTLYNMLNGYFARTIAEQQSKEKEAARLRAQAAAEAAAKAAAAAVAQTAEKRPEAGGTSQ